jgi:hypothetical protein
VKEGKIGGAWACMREKKNAYKVFIGELEGKGHLYVAGGVNVKTDVIGWKYVNCIRGLGEEWVVCSSEPGSEKVL